jgi:S1-C subfamily serine protease
MRPPVALPVVCAVLGGAVAAGGLMVTGVASPPAQRTVVQEGSLLAASPVGTTPAGDVYQRDAAGVVALRARTVATPPTAFDDGTGGAGGGVTGAAVVVDAQGLLLTAAHLVRAATQVEVDCGGRHATASIVGLDLASDLAVLRVRPDGLDMAALPLGDSEAVRVGDPAVALGREPGAAPALSAGIIAARQTTLAAAGGGRVYDALQIDADLGPSDVGGPLVDAAGRVIGVTTRMRTAAGGAPVDLAVPVETARRLLAGVDDTARRVVGG